MPNWEMITDILSKIRMEIEASDEDEFDPTEKNIILMHLDSVIQGIARRDIAKKRKEVVRNQ